MARAATASDAFHAVAEPRRRDILNHLALEERAVGEIVGSLEQPSASKHLRVLRDVGLVRVRPIGRHMFSRTHAEATGPARMDQDIRTALAAPVESGERARRGQTEIVGRDLIRIESDEKRQGGTMIATPTAGIENLTLNITQEIHVRAALEVTFAALLEQLGPENDTPDGKKMAMKLEAWPGGRWYRDLGDDNGHFWGQLQAIKRPTLLEITGPLFMSYAVASNLQYRLSEEDGGTLIKFHHSALGLIQDDHRQGIGRGWTHMHNRVRERAEASGRR